MLGAALLVAEAFLPSFGVLGIGGIVALLIGSLFLFDDPGGGIAVDRGIVFTTVIALGACMLAVSYLVVKAQRRRAQAGQEALVGEVGLVIRTLDPVGKVKVRGEIWTAESGERIEEGQNVLVDEVDGLRLKVKSA